MFCLLRVVLVTLGGILIVVSLSLTPARWQTPSMWLMYANFDRYERVELYRIRADGSQRQRLTQNAILERLPRWSPNGAWLAYAANGPFVYSIYRLNLATLREELVAEGEGYIHALEWSPDGGWLIFETTNRNIHRTWQIQVNRTTRHRPPEGLPESTLRTMSADGRWFAYPEYLPDNNLALYVTPVNGSQRMTISTRLAGDGAFSWSPRIDFPWRGGMVLILGIVLAGVGWGTKNGWSG